MFTMVKKTIKDIVVPQVKPVVVIGKGPIVDIIDGHDDKYELKS